jgi:uncharacterized protein (TIGR03083 family)
MSMPDPNDWINELRASHDRFAALVEPMSSEQVQLPSCAEEWTIAQVASHLGSSAEIFELFLAAGLDSLPVPGHEVFGPIWDRWNNLPPTAQARESIAANTALVTRLEQIPAGEQAAFALSIFGMDVDLSGFAAMRLGEHVLHTWDIAAALDPAAGLPSTAAGLLLETVAQTAARGGRPAEGRDVVIATTDPERRFVLSVWPEVALRPVADGLGTSSDTDVEALRLPAEALIRLVYGRLAPSHTPEGVEESAQLDRLRTVFPGF